MTLPLLSLVSIPACTGKPGSVRAVAGAAPGEILISPPGDRRWHIVVTDPGLMIGGNEIRDGARAFSAANARTGLSISVYIQPAEEAAADHRAVREYFWKQTKRGGDVRDARFWDTPDAAYVRYVVPNVLGSTLSQRSVGVFIAHDGMWIDVRISAVGTLVSDALLEELARSVRVR